MSERMNIGMLVDDIDSTFTRQACKGAELGAMSVDANLYIFPMKYLDSKDFLEGHSRFEYQYNMIYRFITDKNIDILFVMMGNIGCRTEQDEQVAFLQRLPDIPIITLYTKYEGFPAVIFNNRIGLEKEILHIIKEHHVTDIGFVSGPLTNGDAVERLNIYRSVLEDNGIPYDEKKVVYGNFEKNSEEVVEELLNNNPEMKAIVFANDFMALGGYRVFEKREMEVGKDILVAGFDNIPFGLALTPTLTTVDARAAVLSYHAVKNSEHLLNGKDFKIDTHFIRRESCGCNSFDSDYFREKLGLDNIWNRDEFSLKKVFEYLFEYLFEEYGPNDILSDIEHLIVDFAESLFEMVHSRKFDEIKIKKLFYKIINEPILSHTTAERCINVLMSFKEELLEKVEDDADRLQVSEIFSMIFRILTLHNRQTLERQQDHLVAISEMVNKMTTGIFMYDGNTEDSYYAMFQQFGEIGVHSAYMYTFHDTIRYYRGDVWQQPKTLQLKAYVDDGVIGVLSSEDATIDVNDISGNMFLPEHRVTMVLSPLYAFEEVYGVLLCEVDYHHFDCVTPISIHLSSALKSLILIEKQRDIQRELERNLKEIEKNNRLLNNISKTDELTGLFNRRGFIEKAQQTIANKVNRGKYALISYSDIDHLESINEEYGSEEGELVLQETAQILLDAFRSTDIVCRFGGDEFVCLAVVKIEGLEDEIKKRIQEITMSHSTALDKSYSIQMSIGMCEFQCSDEIDIYKLLDIANNRLYEEKKKKQSESQ